MWSCAWSNKRVKSGYCARARLSTDQGNLSREQPVPGRGKRRYRRFGQGSRAHNNMDILGAAAAAATRAEAEDEAQGPPVDSPDGLPSEDEDGPPENDDDEDAGVNGEEHEAADDAVDQLEQQAGANAAGGDFATELVAPELPTSTGTLKVDELKQLLWWRNLSQAGLKLKARIWFCTSDRGRRRLLRASATSRRRRHAANPPRTPPRSLLSAGVCHSGRHRERGGAAIGVSRSTLTGSLLAAAAMVGAEPSNSAAAAAAAAAVGPLAAARAARRRRRAVGASRREAAVERATAGRKAARAAETRAGACATAVKVQRARARVCLLM